MIESVGGFVWELIKFLVTVLFVMIISTILHESGHAVMYEKYTGKSGSAQIKPIGRFGFEIIVGEEEEYEKLSPTQMVWIYTIGLLVGLVPILFLIGNVIALVTCLGIYFVLSWQDIKGIYYETRRREPREAKV